MLNITINFAKHKIKRLEQKKTYSVINNLSNVLKKFFLNRNQILLLCGNYKKISKSLKETLWKAYKHKFICCNTGYKMLQRDLPLPNLKRKKFI